MAADILVQFHTVLIQCCRVLLEFSQAPLNHIFQQTQSFVPLKCLCNEKIESKGWNRLPPEAFPLRYFLGQYNFSIKKMLGKKYKFALLFLNWFNNLAIFEHRQFDCIFWFLVHLENIQVARGISSLSGKFLHCLENFRIFFQSVMTSVMPLNIWSVVNCWSSSPLLGRVVYSQGQRYCPCKYHQRPQ